MGKDGRRGEVETGGDSKNPGSNSILWHRLFDIGCVRVCKGCV